MNIETLERAGINYKKGLARFSGDYNLYNMVLESFLDEQSFAQAENALMAGEYGALYEHIHAVKGISGNLEMTELYHISGELSALLRKSDRPDEAAVAEVFERLREAHAHFSEAIARAIEG